MQPRAQGGELASLGYVRGQAPQGSRGRVLPASSGAPHSSGTDQRSDRNERAEAAGRQGTVAHASQRGAQHGKGGNHGASKAEPPVATSDPMDAVAEALAELRTAQMASEDTQSLRGRVDQISVRLSTLDNAVKSQEKGVASLRSDLSSVSKNQGGQQAERAEGLARQMHTLEDSFCEFSSRVDREIQALALDVESARVGGLQPTCEGQDGAGNGVRGALEQRADQLEEAVCSMASQLRACEDRIFALKSTDGAQKASEGASEELRTWVSTWIRAEIVPELKRSLAAADHADIFQAASVSAYEKVSTRLDSEIAARMAAAQQTWHRWSFDLEAVLLRDANGLLAGERVLLRHPIQQVADVTYMHRLSRGEDADIVCQLFPVEDALGPVVAFAGGLAGEALATSS